MTVLKHYAIIALRSFARGIGWTLAKIVLGR